MFTSSVFLSESLSLCLSLSVPLLFLIYYEYDVIFFLHFQVIKLLDSHGAKRDSYLSDIVSHVIADSTKPDEYSEAKELFERPVVSVSSLLSIMWFLKCC